MAKNDNLKLIEEILNSDLKYLFFASLISCDTLNSSEDYDRSINDCNFIVEHIDEFSFNDGEKGKKETLKYIKNALKILKSQLPLSKDLGAW